MQSKSTKKSLLASGLSILICLAMLVGTTFAWFTDSVVNRGNKIEAGTLDISLQQLVDGEYVEVGEDPIFNYNLWEPGYSDVVALKVVNNGTLALQWYLKIVANGDAGILGDVIDVYAYIDDEAAITELPGSLDQALEWGYENVGTLNELIADVDGAAHGILYGKSIADGIEVFDDAYAGIILHMRETAGNEYQGESVGTTFDLVLNATQYTYETDGFGSDQYDANATSWDSDAATSDEMAAITDEETKTVNISTARQLAGLAAMVNSGNTYEGYTVELQDDIDLGNRPWTPIGVSNVPAGDWSGATTYFAGSFDGNDHTISNLYVQSDSDSNLGFFGFAMLPEGATIENINFDGAVIEGKAQSVGVLAGALTAGAHWVSGSGLEPVAIKNIDVTNASVTGAKYVGGIIGYAQTSLENLSVSNSNVRAAYDANYGNGGENDSGENAGVALGNLYDLFAARNITVTDSTVSGLSKLGGVVGSSHNAQAVSDCTVTGVNMIIDEDSTDDRFGWISGRAATINEPAYSNNTVSDCTATKGSDTVTVENVNFI